MSGLASPSPDSSQLTYYAPAERDEADEVVRKQALLARQPLVRELLDAGDDHLLILNAKRQIIAASSNLPIEDSSAWLNVIIGGRPGEALGCTHLNTAPNGCGTTLECSQCGATQVVLEALHGKKATQPKECRVLVARGGSFAAMEFRVKASYFEVEGEAFVLLSLADISSQKRKESLERVFFHDVLNLAGGVEGLLDLLAEEATTEQLSVIQMAQATMQDLQEEILVQRDLQLAEGNELQVTLSQVHSRTFLQGLVLLYQTHPACRGRRLSLEEGAESLVIRTDAVLLRRVIGNLLKNAAEASSEGGEVVVDCRCVGDRAVISVRNTAYMPEAVQLQVFQRFFSTKGKGRGLGTYSVKLLTERYLQGQASFVSSSEEGTVFSIALPFDL